MVLLLVGVDFQVIDSKVVHHLTCLFKGFSSRGIGVYIDPLSPFLVPFSRHLPKVTVAMYRFEVSYVMINRNRKIIDVDSFRTEEFLKLARHHMVIRKFASISLQLLTTPRTICKKSALFENHLRFSSHNFEAWFTIVVHKSKMFVGMLFRWFVVSIV